MPKIRPHKQRPRATLCFPGWRRGRGQYLHIDTMHRSPSILVALALVAAAALGIAASAKPSTDSLLQPWAYAPLPVGAVTPRGWLLKQLEIMADGMGGHLALFWSDVARSVWVGGLDDPVCCRCNVR